MWTEGVQRFGVKNIHSEVALAMDFHGMGPKQELVKVSHLLRISMQVWRDTIQSPSKESDLHRVLGRHCIEEEEDSLEASTNLV